MHTSSHRVSCRARTHIRTYARHVRVHTRAHSTHEHTRTHLVDGLLGELACGVEADQAHTQGPLAGQQVLEGEELVVAPRLARAVASVVRMVTPCISPKSEAILHPGTEARSGEQDAGRREGEEKRERRGRKRGREGRNKESNICRSAPPLSVISEGTCLLSVKDVISDCSRLCSSSLRSSASLASREFFCAARKPDSSAVISFLSFSTSAHLWTTKPLAQKTIFDRYRGTCSN